MKQKYPRDSYVVFDFETTGFLADKDEVIQLSAIKFLNGKKESFNRFVKIGIPVPAVITEITGIDTKKLETEGIDMETAWQEFSEFIIDLPLIGHNSINFDKKFLEINYEKYLLKLPPRQAYIDTAMIYKAKKLGLSPKWYENHYDFCCRVSNIKAYGVKYKLTLCCEELGIDISSFEAHRADSDIEMTNLIYLEFLKEYENIR